MSKGGARGSGAATPMGGGGEAGGRKRKGTGKADRTAVPVPRKPTRAPVRVPEQVAA